MCEFSFILKRGDYLIIEDQVVPVKISGSNYKYYKDIIDNIKFGVTYNLSINQLHKGSKARVSVECDYCHNVSSLTYKDYLKSISKHDKYACRHCRQIRTSVENKSDRQKYLYNGMVAFCQEIGYELLTQCEDIENASTRVFYKCPKHGVRETKAYTLFSRYGCEKCSYETRGKNARKNPDDVERDFKKNNGVLLNKDDYTGWNDKNLKVICNDCGKTFITSYCAFMQHGGQVCPKCTHNNSKGERAVRDYLESNGIEFQPQYRFENCRSIATLPFDFYLPDSNTCIEYDGEGHYKPIKRGSISDQESINMLKQIQFRDNIKTDYCKKNNIKLIRIPYWDFDHITEILDKELLTQRYSLVS